MRVSDLFENAIRNSRSTSGEQFNPTNQSGVGSSIVRGRASLESLYLLRPRF
jgi:hypothetical protein